MQHPVTAGRVARVKRIPVVLAGVVLVGAVGWLALPTSDVESSAAGAAVPGDAAVRVPDSAQPEPNGSDSGGGPSVAGQESGLLVEDVTGGIVAGARGWCLGSAAVMESDDSGRMRLSEPCESLRVEAAGYVTQRVDAPLGQTIRMTPAGSISGVVVTAEGETVAGAVVSSDNGGEAVSDEQGRFTLEGLSPGRYQPRAVVLGSTTLEGWANRSLRLDLAEDRRGVEIVAVPSTAATIRVQDALGEPCGHSQVWLRDDLVAETVTVKDHVVVVTGIPEGKYDLEVRCWESRSGIEGLGSFRSMLAVRDREEHTVRVTTGSSVTGQVLAGAEPLVGVRVTVLGTSEEAPVIRSAETDDSGSYTVFGLEPGTYTVAVPGVDEEPVRIEVSGKTQLDWELSARHVISGEVKGARAGDLVTFSHTLGTTTQVELASDGSFVSPELPEGEVEVVLRDRGWVELDRASVAMDGAQWLSFERTAEACALQVQVRDAYGAPLSDVLVEVAGTQPHRSEAAFSKASHLGHTDLDGEVTLEGLSPGGRARLQASVRGGAVVRLDVDPCGPSVGVEMSEGGQVAGDAPRPGESFEVVLDSGDERLSGTYTGRDWAMDGVPAGTHAVSIVSVNGWSCDGEVTVLEGDTTRFDCEPRPARMVRGFVTRDGSAVAGVTVGAGDSVVSTGEAGEFELLVPEIERRVTVFDAEAFEAFEVEVPGGLVDLNEVRLD